MRKGACRRERGVETGETGIDPRKRGGQFGDERFEARGLFRERREEAVEIREQFAQVLFMDV